jgi:hypothetical protein
MTRWVDFALVALQAYFILMNVTVERTYCHSPLVQGDTRFLVAETIDFSQNYNPLFLARPQWMVVATCTSAYGFLPFYLLIAIAAITGRWRSFQLPIAAFVGVKINALFFYHTMEFLSTTPPPALVPYFAVEGPYLLSLALIIVRLLQNTSREAATTTASDKRK